MRLEHVDVDRQVELLGEVGAAARHRVGAALRPARRGADRDALVRPVELLDRVADEPLPLVPRRRLVALEPVDQLARDEPSSSTTVSW